MLMMANTSLRPDTSENAGSGRIASPHGVQLRVQTDNTNSPAHHRQDDEGAQNNKSLGRKSDDDGTGDVSDFESGSPSDSEEETIISDEIQEHNIGQQSDTIRKIGVSVSNKTQQLSQDDKYSSTGVPPAILGEIRKIVQAELGALKAIVDSERSPAESGKPQAWVPDPFTAVKSGLRIDTQTRTTPRVCSPVKITSGISPDSPRARFESSGSIRTTSAILERNVLVRFAEEEKWAAPGRVAKPSRADNTVPQLSPTDAQWGELFDGQGHATRRLEQVLKGLANYIIDEFMPQKSIVIAPDKMAAFYTHHRVENEAHPLTEIFKCRTKGWSVGLEDIYQDLGCEYYLIPKDVQSRPSIPGLTPAGFAKWITSNFLAYPDAEARRLNHVVSELPINADGPWDGTTERLPKQISRRLFPDKPDRKAQRLLDGVIRDFVEEFLPASPKQTAATRQQPPRIEIIAERRPSASTASNASPRSSRYMPEPRSRANSTSSPQPPPARLGRAYSDDPSRLSLIHTRKRGSEPTLPALPPLSRSSSGVRRRSSPAMDPYRRSVGDIARANSPVSFASGERREEAGDQYQQYVPARADYTPKGTAGERATPRRVAVVQEGAGNPGPTWDEYLSGRPNVSARGGIFGKGHKAPI